LPSSAKIILGPDRKEITRAVNAARMPLVVIYVKAFSGENHSIKFSEKYKNMVTPLTFPKNHCY
jgi:hypothetical protein